MKPVSCPNCRGTRWIVFPAGIFFDTAQNADEGVIEVYEIKCASCDYVAPPLSPEGEAVLARYAAALGRFGDWAAMAEGLEE